MIVWKSKFVASFDGCFAAFPSKNIFIKLASGHERWRYILNPINRGDSFNSI